MGAWMVYLASTLFAPQAKAQLNTHQLWAERGFKYLGAAVNNMPWITLEVNVSVFPPHTLSLSEVIGGYSCVMMLLLVLQPVWASSSHKAAA